MTTQTVEWTAERNARLYGALSGGVPKEWRHYEADGGWGVVMPGNTGTTHRTGCHLPLRVPADFV